VVPAVASEDDVIGRSPHAGGNLDDCPEPEH